MTIFKDAEQLDGQLVEEPYCPYTASLFEEATSSAIPATSLNRANMGTFQDSLRAPVHRWFTYPAGFSYKAVEEAFRQYNIHPGMTVYDPFAGTGTTNVVAKQAGIHSFGVEAHPFVQFVARTKLFWEFDFTCLLKDIDALIALIQANIADSSVASLDVGTLFPELVCKCYSREKLAHLYMCREAILALPVSPFRDFAKLGMTNLLRAAADVATGWPYIAPQKAKAVTKNTTADVTRLLRDQLYQMLGDLQVVCRNWAKGGKAILISGDSRECHEQIASNSVALTFTSPPYLNNYDYADRTRLETYFWGDAKTWGDISRNVRTKLITSATTQINRSNYDERNLLDARFCAIATSVTAELKPKIAELTERRLTKGGKKSYDILVAGYFNDMLRVLEEIHRVLKPGAYCVLILGDSAPYGVYIPTDVYLGEVAKSIGFADYSVEELRVRGGKWKDNPQRHDVALKECILTIRKD